MNDYNLYARSEFPSPYCPSLFNKLFYDYSAAEYPVSVRRQIRDVTIFDG